MKEEKNIKFADLLKKRKELSEANKKKYKNYFIRRPSTYGCFKKF